MTIPVLWALRQRVELRRWAEREAGQRNMQSTVWGCFLVWPGSNLHLPSSQVWTPTSSVVMAVLPSTSVWAAQQRSLI